MRYRIFVLFAAAALAATATLTTTPSAQAWTCSFGVFGWGAVKCEGTLFCAAGATPTPGGGFVTGCVAADHRS